MSTLETRTLQEWATEMAAALEPLELEVPGIQIVPELNANPTPPSIDIYPGAPFQVGAGFGFGNNQVFWTVRARVSTADQVAGYGLLLRLMDPNDPCSVERALAAIDVVMTAEEGVSEFRQYVDAGSQGESLLGCEWRVSHFL
jgi:hypothetical protein